MSAIMEYVGSAKDVKMAEISSGLDKAGYEITVAGKPDMENQERKLFSVRNTEAVKNMTTKSEEEVRSDLENIPIATVKNAYSDPLKAEEKLKKILEI